MAPIIESFLPALVKLIERNKGIIDEAEASRIYGEKLIQLAIARKIVILKTIVLNAKLDSRRRIPCLAIDWDGSKPIWLDRYR